MKQKFLRSISKLVEWLLNRKQPPTQQQIVYGPKKIVNKNITIINVNIKDDGNKHS